MWFCSLICVHTKEGRSDVKCELMHKNIGEEEVGCSVAPDGTGGFSLLYHFLIWRSDEQTKWSQQKEGQVRICWGFPTRMVHLKHDILYRYTIVVGNPRLMCLVHTVGVLAKSHVSINLLYLLWLDRPGLLHPFCCSSLPPSFLSAPPPTHTPSFTPTLVLSASHSTGLSFSPNPLLSHSLSLSLAKKTNTGGWRQLCGNPVSIRECRTLELYGDYQNDGRIKTFLTK